MDQSSYLESRKFRQPYLERTQSAGAVCVLWALLSGPIYFWKNGAQIETSLLVLASVTPLFADQEHSPIDPILPSGFESLVWGAAAVLAPLLLMQCYRCQGWIDIDSAPKIRAMTLAGNLNRSGFKKCQPGDF
jgi:hypothetical protein